MQLTFNYPHRFLTGGQWLRFHLANNQMFDIGYYNRNDLLQWEDFFPNQLVSYSTQGDIPYFPASFFTTLRKRPNAYIPIVLLAVLNTPAFRRRLLQCS